MSSFGLIEENIEPSHIHLDVLLKIQIANSKGFGYCSKCEIQ